VPRLGTTHVLVKARPVVHCGGKMASDVNRRVSVGKVDMYHVWPALRSVPGTPVVLT
jgi:hypothetical protein